MQELNPKTLYLSLNKVYCALPGEERNGIAGRTLYSIIAKAKKAANAPARRKGLAYYLRIVAQAWRYQVLAAVLFLGQVVQFGREGLDNATVDTGIWFAALVLWYYMRKTSAGLIKDRREERQAAAKLQTLKEAFEAEPTLSGATFARYLEFIKEPLPGTGHVKPVGGRVSMGEVEQMLKGRDLCLFARFTGPAPSYGFKPGECYTVHLKGNTVIYSGAVVPYGSTEAFLRNWQVINQLSPLQ